MGTRARVRPQVQSYAPYLEPGNYTTLAHDPADGSNGVYLGNLGHSSFASQYSSQPYDVPPTVLNWDQPLEAGPRGSPVTSRHDMSGIATYATCSGWASKFSVGDDSLTHSSVSASRFGTTGGGSHVSHELKRNEVVGAPCIVCHCVGRGCWKALTAPTVDMHSVSQERTQGRLCVPPLEAFKLERVEVYLVSVITPFLVADYYPLFPPTIFIITVCFVVTAPGHQMNFGPTTRFYLTYRTIPSFHRFSPYSYILPDNAIPNLSSPVEVLSVRAVPARDMSRTSLPVPHGEQLLHFDLCRIYNITF